MSVSRASALISAPALRQLLAATPAQVHVLDATWKLGQGSDLGGFAKEHIPGSQFLDLDVVADTVSTSLPHMLPQAEHARAAMAALDIPWPSAEHADHVVVVYDTLGMFSAPRAWYMLQQYIGAPTKVLDGGLPAWKACGGEIEAGPPGQLPSATEYTGSGMLPAAGACSVDMAEMRAETSGGSSLILDARPPGRFAGTEPEPRPGIPSGAMPRAVSLPFPSVLRPAAGAEYSVMKPPEELRAIFESLMSSPDQRVITTCGSGTTAAVLALAAHEAGLENVTLYDGSWSEWALPEHANPMVTRE